MDRKIFLYDEPRPRRRTLRRRTGLLALSLIAATLLFYRNSPSDGHLAKKLFLYDDSFQADVSVNDAPFQWNSIAPSENIVWHSCSKIHKCARLLLPLDYFTPDGLKTTIALRMIPAPNGPYGKNTSSYKGPIFINPGGPGGSGTQFILPWGEALSTVVGPNFDIIGFDPRGTGYSYPVAQCFESEAEAGIWSLGERGALKSGDDSVTWAMARARVHHEKCWHALGGKNITEKEMGDDLKKWGGGRFMSTASVVTDLVRMTKMLGQEKLQYWGFSYGTVIGQYFAAMYPDKIGRVIIDGVLDASVYRDPLTTLIRPDIEVILDSFFTLCSQAGPDKCPLYASKPAEIRERVFGILNKLEKKPIPVPFAPKGPALLDWKTIKNKMFMSMYKPLATFPSLAADFVAVEQNDQTHLATLVDGFECSCREPSDPGMSQTMEAAIVISCGDGDPFSATQADVAKFLEKNEPISPLFAGSWAETMVECSDWPIQPKWRYTGPFELPSNLSLASSTSSDTSPILILSTRYDPVCPLSDALTVHRRLGSANSRVIVQESMGHCTLTTPSVCTARWVRNFFEDGKVPDIGEEVKCPVKELPFIGRVEAGNEEELAEEDKELEVALKVLSEANFGAKLV